MFVLMPLLLNNEFPDLLFVLSPGHGAKYALEFN